MSKKSKRPIIKRTKPAREGRAAKRNRDKRDLTPRQRQLKAVRLRKRGYSYQEISKQIGVGLATASRYVRDALEEYEEKVLEEAGTLRKLELMRLDRMTKFLDVGIRIGDPKTVAVAIKLMERRAKYVPVEEEKSLGSKDIEQIAREVKDAADSLFASVPTEPQTQTDMEPTQEV